MPKTVSPYTVVGALDQVLCEQAKKIELIVQTKGGWEGWLQCELAVHLLQEHKVFVEREVHCYVNKALAADLVVGKCVVELKALGLARGRLDRPDVGE